MLQAVEIKKNSLYSFISMFARNFANAVAMIIISNYYAKETAGQFLSAILYATIIMQFADFGLDMLLTNEVAKIREKAEDIFSKLLPIKLIFAVIAILIMIGVALFKSNMDSTTRIMLFIMCLYPALSALNNFYTALFRGFEKIIIDAKISIAGNSFILVFVSLCSIWRMNILFIPIIFVISRFINLIQSIHYSQSFIPKVKIKFSLEEFKTVRRKIVEFGLNIFCGNIFTQWDSLILQHMRGETSFAIYQAAARIYQLPITLIDVLINSFMPVLARLHKSEKEKWNLTGFILNKILIISAIPIFVIFFVFPEQIIKLLYFKQDFSEAVNVLRLFGILIVIKYLCETAAYMLTTSGQQGKRMRVVVIATFLSVPIYVFCVHEYGIIGSIIANLIASGLLGLTYIALIFNDVKKWFVEKKTLIIIFFSVFLLVGLWYCRSISMFIMIPLFLAVYVVVVFMFGFSDKEKKYFIPDIEKYMNNIFNIKNN